MFRNRRKERQKLVNTTKRRLLRAIKEKSQILGDACRDCSHSSQVVVLEDIEEILREN